MKKISLISVWNNKTLIEEMKRSADIQKNVEVEYILLENSNREFGSAAKALNSGADKASGEVYVFLHQDIEFLSDDVLEYIYDYAVQNPTVVFGAAGVLNKNNGTDGLLSSMVAGPDKSPYNTISNPEKASPWTNVLLPAIKIALIKYVMMKLYVMVGIFTELIYACRLKLSQAWKYMQSP